MWLIDVQKYNSRVKINLCCQIKQVNVRKLDYTCRP